jgi:asparagine synthase (glutamine-hydrolysing)
MCGIAGYIAKEGVVETDLLMSMARAMRHRGPDAQTCYREANVGLAHARLSIIDLDTGGQPMLSSDETLAVVLNGEIYNFKQLRKELEAEGYVFRTTSDTESLLYAYAAAPNIETFLNRLNGMFAFALYDKSRQRLLLVRDRLGKKPLYLYEDDSCFAFASELKAMQSIPHFRTDTCPEGLQCYLELGFIPAPWSIYKSARKVEPGSYVLIDTSTGSLVEHNTWWNIEERAWFRGDRQPDKVFYEELEELVAQSVRQRLASDVALGAFLSGGLDSSLIVRYAAPAVPNLKTFHCCFRGTSFDESAYADEVAARYHTDHTTVTADDARYEEIVEKSMEVFDEPFNDFSSLPTMLTSRALKKYVTVALSGDGGDELFLGYREFRDFNPPGRVRREASHVLHSLLPHALKGQGALERYASRSSYWLGTLSSLGLPRYLQDEVREHLGVRTPFSFADVIAEDCDRWSGAAPAEQFRMLHLKYSLPDRMFVKVDRASMAYGLEVRCPLADYRLLECVSHLTYRDLTREGLKTVQKHLMANAFSRAFLERPKAGFGVPPDRVEGCLLDVDVTMGNGRSLVISGRSWQTLRDAMQRPRPYLRQTYTHLLHLYALQGWLEHSTAAPSCELALP